MLRRHRSPGGTGQDGLHEDGEHLGEVVWTQSGGRGESPQVDLVRLADMGTVDGVAPVDQARHDVELVADRIGGIWRAAREGGGGVASQHHPGVHVARVASLPGDCSWVESEPVVVVFDGDRR